MTMTYVTLNLNVIFACIFVRLLNHHKRDKMLALVVNLDNSLLYLGIEMDLGYSKVNESRA